MKSILFLLLLCESLSLSAQPFTETKVNGKTVLSIQKTYEGKRASELYTAYVANLNSKYGVKVRATDKTVTGKSYTNIRRSVFTEDFSSLKKEISFHFTLLFSDRSITYQMSNIQFFIGNKLVQYTYDSFRNNNPLKLSKNEMYYYFLQPRFKLREWAGLVDNNIREVLNMGRSMESIDSEIRIEEPVGGAEIVDADPNKIYSYGEVTELPAYPGGMEAFYKTLDTKINYTAEMKETGYSGRIVIGYVVEKSGEMADIKVIRGLCSACDNEVLRVLKQGAKWIPGRVAGTPVRTQMTIPVMFKPNE